MRRWQPGRPRPSRTCNSRYFDESSRQIGVDETNDFIFGELHHVLRQQLFEASARSRMSCRWRRCRRRRC